MYNYEKRELYECFNGNHCILCNQINESEQNYDLIIGLCPVLKECFKIT